jgi:hypothetical protein
MITKFETTSTGGASKGGNGFLYLIGGAIVLYLGYKYIIKPQMDENKKQQEQK